MKAAKRHTTISVRFTDLEYKEIKEEADKNFRSVTGQIRYLLDMANNIRKGREDNDS